MWTQRTCIQHENRNSHPHTDRQYPRPTVTSHHRDHSSATRASPPQESDWQVTLADLHIHVWVCTASLIGTTGVPLTTSRSEGSMRRQRSSSSERTTGFAPPSKSRHPESFPEAGTGPATGCPAPLEENKHEGGWDESGMTPEFVVIYYTRGVGRPQSATHNYGQRVRLSIPAVPASGCVLGRGCGGNCFKWSGNTLGYRGAQGGAIHSTRYSAAPS